MTRCRVRRRRRILLARFVSSSKPEGFRKREAAPLIGLSQPDLSNLYRRRLEGFSIERLSRVLTALGQDVQIVVQPKPPSRKVATLTTLVRRAAGKTT
ncbi:MAG: XRE family transcriptional regulator [Gemmatimonas sp.]|nr:XRE family transcriptional regulator [Gemmatimonas sp.]